MVPADEWSGWLAMLASKERIAGIKRHIKKLAVRVSIFHCSA